MFIYGIAQSVSARRGIGMEFALSAKKGGTMSKRETAKLLESRLINFIYRLEEEEEEHIYSPSCIIGEMLFEINEAKLLLEGVRGLLREMEDDE